MRAPLHLRGRLALLAIVSLLAVGSCTLLEPLTGDSGGADTDRPARSSPPEREPDQPDAPDADRPEEDPPAEDDTPDDADPEEPAPAGKPALEHEVLARGQQSAVRVPLARAVSDAALWADLWAALTANQTEPPPRPEVDFEEETVIVLLLGERRTGGYAVGVERVVERRNEIEVVVEVERPAPGDMVTQALTSPYFVATIAVTGKPVVFTGDDVEAGFEGD